MSRLLEGRQAQQVGGRPTGRHPLRDINAHPLASSHTAWPCCLPPAPCPPPEAVIFAPKAHHPHPWMLTRTAHPQPRDWYLLRAMVKAPPLALHDRCAPAPYVNTHAPPHPQDGHLLRAMAKAVKAERHGRALELAAQLNLHKSLEGEGRQAGAGHIEQQNLHKDLQAGVCGSVCVCVLGGRGWGG